METHGQVTDLGDVPMWGCGIETALEVLDGKWSTLIIRELLGGPLRFNQIRTRLGDPSPKTITERLRRMEYQGILTRTVFAEVPPRVEYTLTPRGRALEPILIAMLTWATEHVGPASPTAASGPHDSSLKRP